MPDNNCMDPQGFNANSRLRASDADRDSAAAVLNNALAEGRLTFEEHSERLDAVYAARTHAELVPLLEDLPGQHAVALQGRPPSEVVGRAGSGGRIAAIFGGATRKGAWHAEPVISVLTVFGGTELDFRDAILPGKEIILKATTVLGGVEIIVPPEMRVVDNGIAILGGREITGNPGEAASPDAPVLRVEGTCVLGGIEVKRKSRKPSKALKRGKGVNVGIEQLGILPAVRIRPADPED
jgi:Domain of unknown function (DUF1707)/Cell wall-active antibiotics response 4TMS YvqF